MAAPRRRSAYKYTEAGSTSFRRHPDMKHPPDGYSLIEADLHRATTSLEVASFPFLSQLKLRSAINLSAEPIHGKAIQFFLDSGVAMLNPRALEAFDGPYDLWEEAAKESLELLLDADNHPMILLDSPTECESACLVGCLRRLQHWSVVAIHNEYHMLTMRKTWYSTSQQFIERFDLDLVSLTPNLPPWYRKHLSMLEEERAAEAELSRRDPDRATRLWVHGHGAFSTPTTPPSEENEEKGDEPTPDDDRPGEASPPHAHTHTQQPQAQPQAQPSTAVANPSQSSSSVPDEQLHAHQEIRPEEQPQAEVVHVEAGDVPKAKSEESGRRGEEDGGGRGSEEEGRGEGGAGEREGPGKSAGTVSDFRLSGFVHVCPLVSEGCKFTAKAWLQDEDD